MTRIALTLTAALMASATAVSAMQATDLDINGDGFATIPEINQIFGGIAAPDFNRLDKNNDNRLSSPELQAAGATEILGRYEPTMSIVHGLSDIDSNGDRFLTIQELQVVYEGLDEIDFRQIDSNRDQRVNAVELYAPRAQAIVTRYELGPAMPVTIMAVDTDGDFFADFDELMAAYPGLDRIDFNRIDMNNDNRIHSREYYDPDAQAILDRN